MILHKLPSVFYPITQFLIHRHFPIACQSLILHQWWGVTVYYGKWMNSNKLWQQLMAFFRDAFLFGPCCRWCGFLWLYFYANAFPETPSQCKQWKQRYSSAYLTMLLSLDSKNLTIVVISNVIASEACTYLLGFSL